MKRCSSLLVISEIQIKTTMRYHFNQSEGAPLKKATNNKPWRRSGEKRTLMHCWRDISWSSHYGKQYEITQKTKNRVAIWSSNLTPRKITRENCNLKRYMHHPYVQSSSIYNSQALKQRRCPSAEKRMKKMWSIHCRCYSVCRVWLFTTPWTAALQAFPSFTVSLFAQIHVHWIRDTIQPSHLLPSPSLPAFNLSQHQGFLQESAFPISWRMYCSFSFSISPSNEYSEFIPLRIDWFDPLAVQGTLKSLLQYHSSKASILQHSVLYGPTLTFIHPCWKNHSHTDLCQQSDVSAFQYTV